MLQDCVNLIYDAMGRMNNDLSKAEDGVEAAGVRVRKEAMNVIKQCGVLRRQALARVKQKQANRS